MKISSGTDIINPSHCFGFHRSILEKFLHAATFSACYSNFTDLIFSTPKLFENRATRTSSIQFVPRKCVFHSRRPIRAAGKKARTHLERLRYIFIRLGRRSAADKTPKPTASRIANQQKHTRPCGAVGGDFECCVCVCVYGAGSGRSVARSLGGSGGRGALVARLVTTRGSARLHSERASERP